MSGGDMRNSMHQNDIVSGKMSSDIENMDWSMGTTTAQLPNVRFGSSSSQASQNSGDICRICHCESDPQNPLLTPCYCSGSLKYVHQTCLQQWLTASETNSCELCKFPFIMHTKIKPFNEWRSLDMSGVERRRLFCAVLFHCAAALCVIWSLCVLIERAAEEVKRGLIGWPFWTKLVVVTVGLTGGVVFMYIQCRQYLHLCHRWRARNRILLIQNAPEKIHPISPPSPVLIVRHQLHQQNLPRATNMTSGHSTSGSASNNYNRSAHGQIIANIENNPSNYERDWMLDDSSQSSFKPCPQGSGSLTPLPFHDSAHTMYDSVQMRSSSHSSTHGSGPDLSQMPNAMHSSGMTSSYATPQPPPPSSTQKTHEMSLFKAHGGPHYPNSSVFLENSDILDDKDYPKLYHRHSTIIAGPESTSTSHHYHNEINANRRYSDTKLLNADSGEDDASDGHDVTTNAKMPIFNVTSVLGTAVNHNATLTATANDSYVVPQITDIIFENNVTGGGTFDPLELNIQEMLELDMANGRHGLHRPRHSMHNVALDDPQYARNAIIVSTGPDGKMKHEQIVRSSVENRNLFKSMPNLSASSENLLQK